MTESRSNVTDDFELDRFAQQKNTHEANFGYMEQDEAMESQRSSAATYEILTSEEIVQHMLNCITDVNNVVEIPMTTTRILLNYFRWDKEKLVEKFYEGDQEELFKAAHVHSPYVIETRQSQRIRKSVTEDCDICFQQHQYTNMTGLQCGHRFCKLCWVEYLTTKIMDEGMCESIACAANNCEILVDDVTVMSLLKEPRVIIKYQQLITNRFVECNRLLRWCPSADCTFAVKFQYPVDAQPVKCKCGHVFCFNCGEQWHDPVRCSSLRKWIKKCNDDSETTNWIVVNTKDCPKCNVAIEKNGGCNHMSCTNQSCKNEFCWSCLQKWPHEGGYRCNKYKEDEAQENTKVSLARYLHYFSRYMNHMQSLKFESMLYSSVEAKMEEMQRFNWSWVDVQFLNDAVDVLCQCRQTLMYTYVFAFFLKTTNQSEIFEDNQKDLETATENLSEYLEREVTSEDCADIKQKVLDKYKYCEMRRSVLADHVREGYDNNWWDIVE